MVGTGCQGCRAPVAGRCCRVCHQPRGWPRSGSVRVPIDQVKVRSVVLQDGFYRFRYTGRHQRHRLSTAGTGLHSIGLVWRDGPVALPVALPVGSPVGSPVDGQQKSGNVHRSRAGSMTVRRPPRMSGQTPCLRAPVALRTPCREQILAHMENFSTPRQATLPWIANLATLTVVIAAIGWSGGQRPDVPTAAAAAPDAALQTAPSADPGAAIQPGTHQGRRPVKLPSGPIDGLQVVGYSPGQTP